MKNRILFYLIALFSVGAFAQNATIINRGTVNSLDNYLGGINAAKMLQVPEGDHSALYPNVPMARRIQINTTTGKLEYYYGGTWQDAGSGSGVTPNLDQVLTVGNTTSQFITAGGFTVGGTTYQDGSVFYDGNEYNFPTSPVFGTNLAVSWNTIPADGNGNIDVPVDTTPTSGSNALITSAGVFTGLAGKFNQPTGLSTQYLKGDGTVGNIDSTPTSGSANLATSGGIFSAIAAASGSTPDATTTTKGKVQLAGDLAGTADTPTVVTATASRAGKIQLLADLNGSGSSYTNPKVAMDNLTETVNTFLGKVSTGLISPNSRIKFGWVTGDQQAIPNSDSKLFFNEGMHARNGVAEAGTNGQDISLTQNSRTYARSYMDGDSMTEGYLLGSANQSWPSKFGYYNSLNFTNAGLSGQTTAQLVKGLYDATPYELKFIAIGVNDLRLYGSTAAVPYSNLIRTKILQSYGTDATKGQQMTYSGTDWTNDQLQSNTATGIKTTVNSSPATCVRIGTSVYVTIAYENLGTATYTISIDGVPQGGTFTADSYAAFPNYPTASGAASVAYYPYTHRFSGLSVGQHTVSIVKTGGASNLRVIGVMSNAGLKTSIGGSGLSQYVFSVWKMNTTGYTTYPGNIAGLSDTTTDTYNAALYSVVNELANDGLNVMYYDVNLVAPPIDLYMFSDGLHRNDLAYTAVALDLTEKIFPAARREHYLINQLPLILTGKVGFSDLGSYVDTGSAQNITGVKKFTFTPRKKTKKPQNGSTSNGSLVLGTSGQGAGLVSSRTNATQDAAYSENTNSGNLGYIHGFYSNTTGSRVRVSGFNNIGQLEVPNATANNQAVTLGQVKAMGVTNTSMTTIQTAATLNAAYPTATEPFKVLAPNVGSGMVFHKTSVAGQWIAVNAATLNP